VSDAVSSLGKFKDDALAEIGKWIEGMGTAVKNFFLGGVGRPSLASQLLQFGRDAIQGFFDGIIAQAALLPGKIGDFIRQFLGGFQEGLGIHSPSTVMFEIGQEIGNGLEQGIESTTGAVTAAAKALAQAAGASARTVLRPDMELGERQDQADRELRDKLNFELDVERKHFGVSGYDLFGAEEKLKASIPNFDHGGVMPHDGLAYVHAGEVVGQGASIVINIGSVDSRERVDEVQQAIYRAYRLAGGKV